MRVFVSSTVFDLVDVRAELWSLLKSLGVMPVLSDEKLSDFDEQVDVNSIETCLVNVERSDLVIFVLSQRYGPRLGKFGFEDCSATHLEYRRAIKLKKPILFYVRDRLEADFMIWKKNNDKLDLTFAWAEDTGLFEFLAERRKLVKDSNVNNWISFFTNSIDLKDAVRRKLEPRIRPQLVLDAIADNRFPLFTVDQKMEDLQAGPIPSLKISVKMTNVGGAPAFNFSSRWASAASVNEPKTIIAPNQSAAGAMIINVQGNPSVTDSLMLDYDSAIGVHVSETYEVRAVVRGTGAGRFAIGGATLESRVFRNAPELKITIEQDVTD